jgi:hypothetical protein
MRQRASRANFNETPPRERRSRANFSETTSWTPSQRIWPTAGQRRAAGPSSMRRDSRRHEVSVTTTSGCKQTDWPTPVFWTCLGVRTTAWPWGSSSRQSPRTPYPPIAPPRAAPACFGAGEGRWPADAAPESAGQAGAVQVATSARGRGPLQPCAQIGQVNEVRAACWRRFRQTRRWSRWVVMPMASSVPPIIGSGRRQGSTIPPFAVPAAPRAWLDSPIVGGSMLGAWTKH